MSTERTNQRVDFTECQVENQYSRTFHLLQSDCPSSVKAWAAPGGSTVSELLQG